MARQFEGCQVYDVKAYGKAFTGVAFETFRGDRAYSDASDFYEEMKAHPDVREIWFTRMDGPNPVFVEPVIKRNAAGEWVEAKEVRDAEGDDESA